MLMMTMTVCDRDDSDAESSDGDEEVAATYASGNDF